MARIRTIKPDFFEDERLATLPPHDRLLFICLWCLADKNGVLENRPSWIKAKAFPYENGEATDASQMLPRLVSGGYLVQYAVDGRDYLWIRNFSKHQRISGKELEAGCRYPMPSEELQAVKHRGSVGEAPEKHLGAQEGKGREGKGKEMNTAKQASLELDPVPKASRTRAEYPEDFQTFWESYPRREGKANALRQWKRLSQEDRQEAAGRVEEWAKGKDPKYVPHAERYLKDRRWTDEALPENEVCPHPHGSPKWLDWCGQRGLVQL